jgi:uncharacterized membrane protein
MAYREKTAWLTLTCMVIAYAVYFGWVILVDHGADPSPLAMLWWFGSVTGVQAIVVIIGSILLAVQARRDAQARPDERDRAIARRGASIGYYVLMVGMILVGVVMPFEDSRWAIINTALLALVAAEAVKYAIVVASYRRGWHG